MKLVVNKKNWWAEKPTNLICSRTKLYEIEEEELFVNRTYFISSFLSYKNNITDIELAIRIISKKDSKVKIKIISDYLFAPDDKPAMDRKFTLEKIEMPNIDEKPTKEKLKNILFLSSKSFDAGTDYSIYLTD